MRYISNCNFTSTFRRHTLFSVGRHHLQRNNKQHITAFSQTSALTSLPIFAGSYAKVIQAEHKKTGAVYAIKIIKKQMFSDDEVSLQMRSYKS